MKKREANNNKTNTTGNIIRSIFQQELKKFEGRFDAKIDSKLILFESKMDFKLENLESRVDENAQRYRDEVLTSNDKLAKKFETVQQELELGNLQMKRQLEDHEERITTLESSQKS